MGQKELLRGKVMELVKRGKLTIRAVDICLLCERGGPGPYSEEYREAFEPEDGRGEAGTVWGLRADLSGGETGRSRRGADQRGYAEEMADSSNFTFNAIYGF